MGLLWNMWVKTLLKACFRKYHQIHLWTAILYLQLFPALQDAEVQAFVWSLFAVGEANLQSLRTWKISWRRRNKFVPRLLSLHIWKASRVNQTKKIIKANLLSILYCCGGLSWISGRCHFPTARLPGLETMPFQQGLAKLQIGNFFFSAKK